MSAPSIIEIVGRAAINASDIAIGDGESYEEFDKRRAIAAGRAAIEAMREPTPEMLSTGEGYMDFILPECFDNSTEGRIAEFKVGYQMALDVALGTDPVTRGAARIAERRRRAAHAEETASGEKVGLTQASKASTP